jgi:hypothetical protein
MRSKVVKPANVPQKFARYRPGEWPGGWGDWADEREAWNAAQEPIVISGKLHDGRPYAYEAGPLGDEVDLLRARREARAIDWHAAYPGQ